MCVWVCLCVPTAHTFTFLDRTCVITVYRSIEVHTPRGVYQAHAMLLMCATDLIAM